MIGVRGVTWLVWRQHRAALWALLALTVLVGGYLAYGGYTAAEAVRALGGCAGQDSAPQCSQALTDFQQEHQYPLRLPLQLLLLLPMLLGVFLGAPLFAQELESGTLRTALSQSVSRARLLRAKLAVPVMLTLVAAGVITACATWWWHTVAGAVGSEFPWYMPIPFDAVGPAPVAKALLVLMIGVTLSLLLRRTIAAMAATGTVGGSALFALEQVRGGLWPTVIAQRSGLGADAAPGDAWLFDDGLVVAAGRRVPQSGECFAADDYKQCLAGKGVTGHWAEFHPSSHFWPLQWAETGLCLAAAAALAGLCFWWTRHRLT
ncbi:ABC transporter permease subunit [Streptomyces sp. NPDC047718]|uniref:ABC transporter permease subunit n=1 Tax=Streptomyces sp. NPDC047718 TaxID=3155479 RepID=UPI0033FEBA9C